MKVYDPILCMMVEKQDVKDEESLKKGQKYRNKNGITVEIISVEPNYVLADFGGTKKDFSPYGLKKILLDNGYKKVSDKESVKDEKTKTNDAAVDDFKKAIQLVEQIRQITRKHSRNIDANAVFAYCDKIQDKYQYYVDNAHRGWYD